ncbi:putative reverse transcriptase domain-containing protein [Tanacetum coccineum]
MMPCPRIRASIQALFGGVTDWYPKQRLWQLWLFLSSDLSDESVGSSFSRVILIGSIFVEVLVASEVGAAAVASPVGVLELDTYSSSEADPSKSSLPPISVAPMVSPFLCSDDLESDTKIPERHVSPTPHDAMLTRWRSRVASRSSSHTTSTPEIPTAPTPSAPPAVVAPSTDIISPVDAPPGIYHSSSDHSSSGHSILSHSVFRHTSLVTTIADSSAPSRFVYTPLARTLRYSKAYRYWRSTLLSTMYPPKASKSSALDSSSESSAGPSRKRCRSPAATVTSSIHALRALFPSHADLLRPRKSFRDFISPKDSVKEDIDIDVLADIEADAIANEVATDMDVEAGVDAEVGVDVVARINIPDSMLMPDAMEHLEQVEEVVHDIYRHVMEIPLQRVEDIKTGQRELEARSLIAAGERASLLDQVASLERSNTRLRGTLMMESARADRFQRRMGFMERELKQIHRQLKNSLTNEWRRRWLLMRQTVLLNLLLKVKARMDMIMTTGILGGGIEMEMAGEMEIETMEEIKTETKEAMGMEIPIGMTELLCLSPLVKLMTEVDCPRNEIQKMESELWNLTVKNNDLATYTQRFQELTMMCTKMVPKEEYRVEKFIGDQKLKGYVVKNAENKRRFDNNQKDNRVQQPPYKRQNVGGQSVARAYTAGNNEKRGYAGPLPYCKKCKLHHEGPCTVKCEKCNQVGHMVRDYMNIVAATTTQRALVVNQRVPTYFECGRQGHYRNECPKLKNQTCGNKAGKKTNEARGKAYVLGGGKANPDSNVIMGTFLLNNLYASMLFDLGADRSFVSSTFSALLDVIPSMLDVSYAVELADGRITETNIMLRGYTLGLLGHPFNIDLMPVELGSFDVIISMDCLANHYAVIVCDEKIVIIPYGDEVFIV